MLKILKCIICNKIGSEDEKIFKGKKKNRKMKNHWFNETYGEVPDEYTIILNKKWKKNLD